MAGLPGTGLGGVFYVLLIIWIIFRKFLKADEHAQWRRIAPLGVMAVVIAIVLWAEMWIIARVVGRLPTFADILALGTPVPGALALVLTLTPLLSLAALLSALHIARLILPRERAGLR